ncbi:DUF6343 family protein [Frankia sp. EI5c]|uniref:DUF6343 family protein n=1 Tax=Frankia sp. EI5c TaxID=683316 RepID=UPI000825F5D8|nr:DUF6343 family protein [Frankia sp. EI5c]
MTRQVPRQRSERPTRPQPWWRSAGSWGDRWTGAPPAGSALGLRRALALFGLVFCGVTAGLSAAAGQVGPAVALAVIGLTALVDLVVIHRRTVSARRDGRPRS